MWSVSYIEVGFFKVKSGFSSDKEAVKWLANSGFVAYELSVWSELINGYRTVEKFWES